MTDSMDRDKRTALCPFVSQMEFDTKTAFCVISNRFIDLY